MTTMKQTVAKEIEEFTLDGILDRIGPFGKFQMLIILLIWVAMIFNSFNLLYVFTASSVVHRCNITECDNASSRYNEYWTEFTIPKNGEVLDGCSRYDSIMFNNSMKEERKDVCSAQNFDPNKIEICRTDNFIFRDKEVTIANEFGIYCDDEWKLALVGTINNIGQFFGIPLGGFFADRYGRSTSLAVCGFLGGICGTLRSFSPNFIFFLVFEFLENMTSSSLYATCFIVGIELVGPKKRVIACCAITIFYCIGEVLIALIAKYSQNWRLLLRIVYIPALLHITYLWILPESVRWLLSQEKEERAKAILKRAAAVNKRKLSDDSLDKLILSNRLKLQEANEAKFPIKETFSKFFWRIVNCSFCWIVNGLIYYGLSLNAVLLSGEKYNNFMFIALVEIPGVLIPFLIMDRIGRRYSLFSFMILCGISCLGTVFVGKDQNYLKLTLFLVGKLGISASFQVLYFFTAEIFPTNLRNSLLAFCGMVGRIGSMIAPQTPLLAKYYEDAPAILFASAALLSAFLALLFPETTNLVLPTTLQEADDIGDKKKQNLSGTPAL